MGRAVAVQGQDEWVAKERGDEVSVRSFDWLSSSSLLSSSL